MSGFVDYSLVVESSDVVSVLSSVVFVPSPPQDARAPMNREAASRDEIFFRYISATSFR